MDFLLNLDVDDLGRATAFYQSAFGLKPGRRIGGGGVEMLGGPAPIWLLEKPAGSSTSGTMGETRRYGRHWTPLHLDFITPDVDAAVTRALAAGATLEHPVSTHPWGRLALMADPFGHGYCFVQFLGQGYDEIAE
ncbi:VOC family protein [Solimonas sp. SE-A11]|uniref:VOC family protein n=1 Tax=Solimonas sp. SE-A11 TaxID=3054954 RepID=UPI00259CC9C6|nr:VOC family protein [Solimonas sp. SE-A11]MDM4769300.1 VOC family protein [Solimonas sp. SE-A11]